VRSRICDPALEMANTRVYLLARYERGAAGRAVGHSATAESVENWDIPDAGGGPGGPLALHRQMEAGVPGGPNLGYVKTPLAEGDG